MAVRVASGVVRFSGTGMARMTAASPAVASRTASDGPTQTMHSSFARRFDRAAVRAKRGQEGIGRLLRAGAPLIGDRVRPATHVHQFFRLAEVALGIERSILLLHLLGNAFDKRRLGEGAGGRPAQS